MPGIDQAAADDASLYALLTDRLGMSPVRSWSRASIDIPPADAAWHLELETVEPSWLVESLHRDGRPGRRWN